MDKVANFSIEVYGKGFLTDYVKTEALDNLVSSDIKAAFDTDVMKTLTFMSWRWDDEKGIMLPIIDSSRTAKVLIDAGRRIKLKDYDVRGEIVEVEAVNTAGGDDVFNGNNIKPGAVVEFHWSEASSWGCVYNIENGDDTVSYRPTQNYLVPDELSPKFRCCGARGTGPELSAAVATKLNGNYFV